MNIIHAPKYVWQQYLQLPRYRNDLIYFESKDSLVTSSIQKSVFFSVDILDSFVVVFFTLIWVFFFLTFVF